MLSIWHINILKNKINSRNFKNYQTLTEKHKSLSKEGFDNSKNINDFEAYKSKPNQNIIDKINNAPIIGMNSRDFRLREFRNRSSLQTLSNPKAKRYHRDFRNSYKRMQQSFDSLPNQSDLIPIPTNKNEFIETNVSIENKQNEQKYENDGLAMTENKIKMQSELLPKSSMKNPVDMYSKFKQQQSLIINPNIMYRSFSRIEGDRQLAMSEINKKLDMNCVERVKHNKSNLKFIL